MMSEQGCAWKIRQASANDVDALSLIGSSTFLETFAGVLAGDAIVAHCARVHNPSTYRELLSGGAIAWLAEVDPGAAPIAYALAAQPDLLVSMDGDIELKRIYALSRFHGSGLGAALMDTVVQFASAYQRLLLGVYSVNERARAFYIKNGFEKISDRQFDIGGVLYDDVILAKTLTPKGSLTS